MREEGDTAVPRAAGTSKKKKKRRGRKNKEGSSNPAAAPATTTNSTSSSTQAATKKRANNNPLPYTQEAPRGDVLERFWSSLSKAEQVGLVRLEKAALLGRIKDQQRQSCSCAVCTKQREPMEAELEHLFEDFIAELEDLETRRLAGDASAILAAPSSAMEAAAMPFARTLSVQHGALQLADWLFENNSAPFFKLLSSLTDQKANWQGADVADADDTGLTAEQRVASGRLLVQMFGVAMVDGQVTAAYKEHVAFQRQQELIQEEEQDRLVLEQREKAKEEQRQRKKERRELERQRKRQEDLERQAEAQRVQAEEHAEQQRKELERKEREQKRAEAVRLATENEMREEKKRKAEEKERQRLEQQRLAEEQQRLAEKKLEQQRLIEQQQRLVEQQRLQAQEEERRRKLASTARRSPPSKQPERTRPSSQPVTVSVPPTSKSAWGPPPQAEVRAPTTRAAPTAAAVVAGKVTAAEALANTTPGPKPSRHIAASEQVPTASRTTNHTSPQGAIGPIARPGGSDDQGSPESRKSEQSPTLPGSTPFSFGLLNPAIPSAADGPSVSLGQAVPMREGPVQPPQLDLHRQFQPFMMPAGPVHQPIGSGRRPMSDPWFQQGEQLQAMPPQHQPWMGPPGPLDPATWGNNPHQRPGPGVWTAPPYMVGLPNGMPSGLSNPEPAPAGAWAPYQQVQHSQPHQ